MKSSNTISGRQTGMLCVMTILANKILLLPALMYEGVRADGLLVMMFLFLIDFAVLWVFFMLKKKYPTQTLNEILESSLGKVIAKIIFIIFMAFFLFKLLLTYSVTYMYLKQQVYQDEFAFLALICFLPIMNHAVFAGLRGFSRTIEIFYYVICTGIFLCLAISLINFNNIPTLFDSTPSDFFLTSFRHVFSFGDYLFLFLIIDKVELKHGDINRILRFVSVGIFAVLSIFFMFYSIYQVTAFMHNNALADILVFSIQFSAIGRLDIIAMITIMLLAFFQLEIFQFSFSEAFCNVFHSLSRAYSIVVFDVLFLIVYFVLVGKYENMIFYTEGWLTYFAIFSNFLIPLILFFLALPKKQSVAGLKRGRYEKSY